MNTAPLVTLPVRSLADVADETLADAAVGRDTTCLWCGGGPLRVVSVDIWTGEVGLICPHCGTEMSGVVPRRAMEVSA